jgi:hypothetical protein
VRFIGAALGSAAAPPVWLVFADICQSSRIHS